MWEIEFYEPENGKNTIVDFLESLPKKHRAKAFWEIELLSEHGTALKEPYSKHISDDLWELRIKFSSDISRIFYFIPIKEKIVLLHGFVKKTEKTPKNEIDLAKEKMKEYKRRFL